MILFFLFKDSAPDPTFFIKWKELNIRFVFADLPFYLQQEFSLMCRTQFSQKGTILYALQAIIEASISYFCTRAIMSDIVDE